MCNLFVIVVIKLFGIIITKSNRWFAVLKAIRVHLPKIVFAKAVSKEPQGFVNHQEELYRYWKMQMDLPSALIFERVKGIVL